MSMELDSVIPTPIRLVNRNRGYPHTNQNPQSNEEKEEQARKVFVIGQSLFKSRERGSGIEKERNEEGVRQMVECGV
ncbi:hypothetical protein BLNAU_4768 [Blattamonas nauphoetae]|uniref:Uncharacterized protein n=1 Tax=Blattamonas nauphoetae TaxID=2049346 RepID=A0ABQ9Y934_9EUKA|nr:hypothetical protein BLNAU_4768 [Blattamonas nauphoetae]